MEKYGKAGVDTVNNIIRRTSFACRISKATSKTLEYVILIAFSRQQWLRESTPHCYSISTLPVLVRLSYVNTTDISYGFVSTEFSSKILLMLLVLVALLGTSRM